MQTELLKRLLLVSVIIGTMNFCKKDDDIIDEPTSHRQARPQVSSSPDTSLTNNDTADIDDIYRMVDNTMHSIYYWTDHVKDVDLTAYNDPNTMMQDMLYTKLDRWSMVYDAKVLDDWLNGEEYGYGLYPTYDGNGDVRVALVYKQTEAYRQGLRRGDKIVSINGTATSGNTDWSILSTSSPNTSLQLTYQKNDSTEQTISLSADGISVDQILAYNIIDAGNTKVGYIAYESFSSSNADSLIGVMEYFSADGVSELIVDLRYNGGGEITVLDRWVNMLIPQANTGDTYFKVKHNSYIASEYDTAYTFRPQQSSLGLNRVFVITTENTASASEAFINSLTPYMDVQVVGETTHGKPVGMYVIPYENWYILPISFEYTNAYDEGGFYSGIDPDYYITDDATKNWGDPEEACLAACLSYIETGSYNIALASSGLKSQTHPVIPFKQYGFLLRRKY